MEGIADRILNAWNEVLSISPENIAELGTTVPIPTFDEQTVIDICNRATLAFQSLEPLLEIPHPVYIVGDLHGNIFDLVRILIMSGLPPRTRFLFLGDYVDRGQYSVEIITLLFALLAKYPDNLFLLRGNHEFSHVNAIYGFKTEVETLYHSEELYNTINETFNWMPLTAIVGEKIFCVHGGISPQVSSIRQLKRIKRPITTYDNNVSADLTWSDPSTETKEFLRSSRGNGVAFGVTAVKDFLASFNITHIIRAHQCVPLGIERFAGDSLYTVFSCSNYQDACGNRCGLLFVMENGQLQSFSLPPITQILRENANLSGHLKPCKIGTDDCCQLEPENEANDKRNSFLCLMKSPSLTNTITAKRRGSLTAYGAKNAVIKPRSFSKNSRLPQMFTIDEVPVFTDESQHRPGTADPIHPPLLTPKQLFSTS